MTDSQGKTLRTPIGDRVLPESMIFTDEWRPYERIGREFKSRYRIPHKQRIYVGGEVHANTIEGFFGLLKNGICGTHQAVSAKWLQSHLDEFVWRYNRPSDERSMFRSLILATFAT